MMVCFQQNFSYIMAASAPIYAFLEFIEPVLCTIFFSSHWLLSHITIVETMDSSERGMNPVAMIIINPRKEYWPGRGIKPATLLTELCKKNIMKAFAYSMNGAYLYHSTPSLNYPEVETF